MMDGKNKKLQASNGLQKLCYLVKFELQGQWMDVRGRFVVHEAQERVVGMCVSQDGFK